MEQSGVKLTKDERFVLQQLTLRPSGMFVREPDLRKAVLDLAERGLVCDPHAMSNALFTRSTLAGIAALSSESDDGR